MGAVRLEPMSRETASAIERGERPHDVTTAEDYPTEFSRGVAAQVAATSALGPYVVIDLENDVVVGEIGGARIEPETVEIGYAVVRSRWRQGFATAAVRELVAMLTQLPDVRRIVAHTPLDRPESARVLEKAGFDYAGERDDENEGRTLRVKRWEFSVPLCSAGGRD